MIRYVARRLVEALVVAAAMSFVVHILLGLMPGDPIDLMFSGDPELRPEDRDRLRAVHGLDRPLVERYFSWALGAIQGDFGYSRAHGRRVIDVIVQPLINSLILMGLSLALSVTIAIVLGTIAAIRPRGMLDNLISLFCFAGISVPVFWLALLLIMLFSVTLGWLPAGGIGLVRDQGLAAQIPYLVLPVLTLSLATIGDFTRFVRAATMEALRQDYIRTARAKGLSPGAVLFKHALRTALIPVITVVALQFGAMFSGALITETMFSYLGMGKLIYDSIMGNDYNVALVGLLFATMMVLIGNILADVAYAAADPRIRYE